MALQKRSGRCEQNLRFKIKDFDIASCAEEAVRNRNGVQVMFTGKFIYKKGSLKKLVDNKEVTKFTEFTELYSSLSCPPEAIETTPFSWPNPLLKPTGHVMHQQFNTQQLYALPTLYLCVLCLS